VSGAAPGAVAPVAAAPVAVALIGMGRMGRALDALAPDRGVRVVARLGAAELAGGLTLALLNGAQVAIEFTQPGAAVANARACVALGCPVVVGTTGWEGEHGAVEAAVAAHGCPALWSPNFSVGVQLFLALAEAAGRALRGMEGFAPALVETHHAAKRDAPSGTALAIRERVEPALGQAVPVTSVRVGSVPGTHTLLFDAPFEQLRLEHEARDRRVFADGALAAARWLAAGRAPRLYTMRDVLPTLMPEVA
jgi:4-hydroxy-tetrahydrodipicolinate reductase